MKIRVEPRQSGTKISKVQGRRHHSQNPVKRDQTASALVCLQQFKILPVYSFKYSEGIYSSQIPVRTKAEDFQQNSEKVARNFRKRLLETGISIRM